ncbi:MAG: hypothetical protein XD93_0783 [candidate division WS6 bacterium 34_10]|uniref:Uncharacterized protein n=1 Tax=candidate division WS6 bacterium 34_10 TaxID=1641389 RepID=A0A101HH24_9BACT|nr:MAG: hypothetical protein XD93_0783 [candidate division WS6 bacterium 34_10]
MSSNPFLSKEVKLKRVRKGFVIALPVVIMIFVIGNHYINLIDDTLRNHYVGENQNQDNPVEEVEENKVLGEFSFPSDSLFYADEYIDTRIDERDGYDKFIRHIDEPSYYFKDGEVVTLKDSWLLKNGYELNLVCGEVDLKKRTDPADFLTCEIYYNGNLVVDNVYYNAYCSDIENFQDCFGKVSFAVFSYVYPPSSPEFLVTSYRPTGFDSSISIFNLENGKANRLSFETKEGKVYEDVYTRVFTIELYEEQDPDNTSFQREVNTIELVTFEFAPGYDGFGGRYHVWEIEDDHFVESKSITVIDPEN